MAAVNITRASVTDADRIAPVFDLYRQFYQQPSDIGAARAFLKARLEANESVVFIASNDQQVLGFTQLYPLFTSVGLQRDLLLNDLFVVESARGQSVAKLLMNAARDYAVESGARGLGLETTVDNKPAQALYEALGYEWQTEFYHYYLNVKGTG